MTITKYHPNEVCAVYECAPQYLPETKIFHIFYCLHSKIRNKNGHVINKKLNYDTHEK
jgi:hypothetical protein